ncbi:MaoC family dehydratase [Gemmobacter sp.]|uniref:MaoC family dehydratase n=1 Tax=Gemmobacter sp. TaxID=1898957 RepID=UPI002AFE64A8|nr:MaoC family dehydratase [Gemmobacter sp.]
MIRAGWTPTLDDFRAFARLSGDDNPIHTDPAYAATHPFGRPVCHGMLIHARLWALGQGAGLAGRVVELMFPNPAHAGDPLVLTLARDGTATLAEARRQDGTPVCLARWDAAP